MVSLSVCSKSRHVNSWFFAGYPGKSLLQSRELFTLASHGESEGYRIGVTPPTVCVCVHVCVCACVCVCMPYQLRKKGSVWALVGQNPQQTCLADVMRYGSACVCVCVCVKWNTVWRNSAEHGGEKKEFLVVRLSKDVFHSFMAAVIY